MISKKATHTIISLIVISCLFPAFVVAQETFTGSVENQTTTEAIKVRNDVAQPGTPIVTKRYFKIKKGSFPGFLKASQEGVWPYFEKIGSRVIGMWQVTYPEVSGLKEPKDYDEAILMTQYASIEHWQATRKMTELGGNGPDWEKCQAALEFRRSLTLETSLEFLQGSTWQSPPYFMPGLQGTSE